MSKRVGGTVATSSRGFHVLDEAPWLSTGLILAFGLLGLVFVFAGTARAMVEQWIGSSAYNHCFLIVPISLYLVWERRHDLVALTPEPDLRFLPLAGLFAGAWLVASAADVAEGAAFALVGMMQVMIVTVLGRRISRLLWLAILYLWLMVPTGGFLLPTLQQVAALEADWLLRLSNIPTYRDGLVLEVPNGLYVIATGCAGLNFLLAALALSPLYAVLLYDGWAKRVAAIGLALSGAIAANGARIFGIIALAELTDRRIDIVDDHLLYGWGFFSLILLLMAAVGLVFADRPPDPPAIVRAEPADAFPWPRLVAATLACLIVAVFAVGYERVASGSPFETGRVTLRLPPPGDGWRESEAANDWSIHYPGAHLVWRGRFAAHACCVDVNVAYFWRQSDERELIADGNAVADPRIWRLSSVNRQTVMTPSGALDVNTAILDSGSRRRLVWYWYWVDGRWTAGALTAKLWQAKAALLWGDRRSAVIALSAPVTDDDGAAASLMAACLADGGDLMAALAAAGFRRGDT